MAEVEPPAFARAEPHARSGAARPGAEGVKVASLYACLYRPPAMGAVSAADEKQTLVQIAEVFSPRYEQHGDHLVSIDVRGLDRLLGSPRTIGEELRREAAARAGRAHVAVARTRMAAQVLALVRPGLTVVDAGDEAAALASIPVGILETLHEDTLPQTIAAVSVVKHWGIRTLGELAALPAAELTARVGLQGLAWQAIARGEDTRPLVPTRSEERFEASLELEWPIEGLEPLSFVLTRLLEPLSTRLERRDRGVAVLHVALRLVTRDVHACRLELPSPMREVRALRTLALLDLEAHPPAGAIDRVTITIDPTPGRILQHTLFTRPHPTPEQLSTLLARLGALMGQDRIGCPGTVDSYRPGAFAMNPFAIDRPASAPAQSRASVEHSATSPPPSLASQSPHASVRQAETLAPNPSSSAHGERRRGERVVSALRRCRQPVPARVAVGIDQRPHRMTTDRQGFAGGLVASCAGPWRTSGEWWEWWEGEGKCTNAGMQECTNARVQECTNARVQEYRSAGMQECTNARVQEYRSAGMQECIGGWDRDEWDVALADGAIYRIFRNRSTDAWFIDGIVD